MSAAWICSAVGRCTPRWASEERAEASASRTSSKLIGAPGVKPARLTLWPSTPLVARVIELPPCRPRTSASAFWREPAHAANSETMREGAGSLDTAAMADEATRSDAASEAASLRWSMRHLRAKCLQYPARGSAREVGPLRECRGRVGVAAVGTLLPGAACQNAAMNLAIVATVVLGVALDRNWVQHGQAAASAGAWLVCLALFTRSARTTRVSLAACLALATAGEVVLSLAWGLYRYRLGNIPLFVPPGHVLLFFLGTQLAGRVPERGAGIVALLALPLVALLAWTGRDTLGPLLYALFLACLWLSPSRRLYAT